MCLKLYFPSAGEHVRLRTRPLLPPLPLHPAAHPATSALSSRQHPHSLSTTLVPFPPLLLPLVLLSIFLQLKNPPPPPLSQRPPPDIVVGNNGTSHHCKLEALSAALPSSLRFVSLSGNSWMFVSSTRQPSSTGVGGAGHPGSPEAMAEKIKHTPVHMATRPPPPPREARGTRTAVCPRHRPPASHRLGES